MASSSTQTSERALSEYISGLMFEIAHISTSPTSLEQIKYIKQLRSDASDASTLTECVELHKCMRELLVEIRRIARGIFHTEQIGEVRELESYFFALSTVAKEVLLQKKWNHIVDQLMEDYNQLMEESSRLREVTEFPDLVDKTNLFSLNVGGSCTAPSRLSGFLPRHTKSLGGASMY
jgi:hypothetical protein